MSRRELVGDRIDLVADTDLVVGIEADFDLEPGADL